MAAEAVGALGALGAVDAVGTILTSGTILGTILTDLCAIGALAAALHSGVTPPALMVGYGMTTLAAVTVVVGPFTNCFGLKK